MIKEFLLQRKESNEWVDIAVSSNLDVLKMFVRGYHQIVNLENKEVMYTDFN